MAGVFGWMMFQLNGGKLPDISLGVIDKNKLENPTYSYFPENTERYIEEENIWERKSFQPVYVGFQEVGSDENYILISYLDINKKVEKGKVFVRKLIPYYDESGNKTSFQSVDLKEELKEGEQFGVEYLSNIPTNFSPNMLFCTTDPIPVDECFLANLKYQSDIKDENVFYAFNIYRILK